MDPMTRRQLLGAITLLAATGVRVGAQKGSMVQVYKDPTCGCCPPGGPTPGTGGFPATVSDVQDMNTVKDTYGVPSKARSCHTAVVNGYTIEGHVPAADVQRLLKERPRIVGIGVPGMPIGSPGMESARGQTQPRDT